MDEFKKFLSKYPAETFEKGSTVLLGGDKPKGVYVVESGLVKTYFISSNGEEHLVSIDGRCAQIPVGYALGVVDVSEYYYEAYERCTVRVVPREDYDSHLKTNISSLYGRHLRMTELVVSLYDRIKALEQPKVGNKIALTLIYLAGQVGSLFGPKSAGSRVSTTQQDIADLTGVSRETVNTGLRSLQMNQLVTYSRKKYLFHTDRIKQHVENDEQ